MLPDISLVFGEYTYFVSEVVFGAVAIGLLVRAGALRAAARTIAVLYPIGYVWDWYSLSIGLFAITLRSGYSVLGIPVEEHIFILVVPAFVLGVHETLGQRSGPTP